MSSVNELEHLYTAITMLTKRVDDQDFIIAGAHDRIAQLELKIDTMSASVEEPPPVYSGAYVRSDMDDDEIRKACIQLPSELHKLWTGDDSANQARSAIWDAFGMSRSFYTGTQYKRTAAYELYSKGITTVEQLSQLSKNELGVLLQRKDDPPPATVPPAVCSHRAKIEAEGIAVEVKNAFHSAMMAKLRSNDTRRVTENHRALYTAGYKAREIQLMIIPIVGPVHLAFLREKGHDI